VALLEAGVCLFDLLDLLGRQFDLVVE